MFQLITTVGPSLLTKDKIRGIASHADCIFRINGAHADHENARDIVQTIRDASPEAKIMIDLPGNKVRTANLFDPIRLKKGESFKLRPKNINYPDFYKHLKVGDVIYANDSIFTLEVSNIENNVITFCSHSDGLLLTNKGLHLTGVYKDLPFLFDRDKELTSLAKEMDIDFLSLSFVRTKEDIREARELLGAKDSCKTEIFAKIETRMAMENLDEIMEEVDYLNMDRGDLSSDIGIHNIPEAQSIFINKGREKGKKIFIATQFLKTMEVNPVPTLSEVDCLHRTIESGVTGIQLSEETAVGGYPFECVKLVAAIFKKYYG